MGVKIVLSMTQSMRTGVESNWDFFFFSLSAKGGNQEFLIVVFIMLVSFCV